MAKNDGKGIVKYVSELFFPKNTAITPAALKQKQLHVTIDVVPLGVSK